MTGDVINGTARTRAGRDAVRLAAAPRSAFAPQKKAADALELSYSLEKASFDRALRRPLMRIACVAALLICAAPSLAHAQNITPEGIARSASLFALIEASCAATHRINVDLARRFQKSFLDVGTRMSGKAAFRSLLAAEIQRRRYEVDNAGAQAWCDAQRDSLAELGAEGVFKD